MSEGINQGISDHRMEVMDKKINHILGLFLKNVIQKADSKSEAAYACTSICQTSVAMLLVNLLNMLPAQEAKAAFKVVMDGALLEHGMHLSIQEFGMH